MSCLPHRAPFDGAFSFAGLTVMRGMTNDVPSCQGEFTHAD
ncbi:hypothetical protein LHK_02857 [Laribacter hongkongensis HLHK9]|uniref:Uncharacterized protein n=1 Tax=Laribacter hongkongensis (strain HLHK9) TaxID=557598 RepID=C1D4P5_LARHH|nr:hypothetical protein LHK_02857 [Laribacter hongkongensis HLHK9]